MLVHEAVMKSHWIKINNLSCNTYRAPQVRTTVMDWTPEDLRFIRDRIPMNEGFIFIRNVTLYFPHFFGALSSRATCPTEKSARVVFAHYENDNAADEKAERRGGGGGGEEGGERKRERIEENSGDASNSKEQREKKKNKDEDERHEWKKEHRR